MDIVNAVVRLVEVTVWPITILIIVLWFRSTITDAIKHLIRQRIIRARIGKFELEFHAGEEIGYGFRSLILTFYFFHIILSN